MLSNRSGSIINISSASAGPPLSKAFPYSVAKAGILNLTQNLGREWGTSGFVLTLCVQVFSQLIGIEKTLSLLNVTPILMHTPMRRFGQPSELIGAVLWLASDASGFVTGSEVSVDGGFSCMTI